MLATRKLTLTDIADARAYERERDEFRTHMIGVKHRRRVGLGDYVTVLFENRDTVRLQIQEMARVERIYSDEAIQTELDIYNVLVPEPGQLCLTLFVELTTDALLREWLPKLVGIERTIQLVLPSGATVPAQVEEDHEAQLTRDDITSTVHYLRFELDENQIVDLASSGGTARLAVVHPAYERSAELPESTVRELLADLRG
jgi:Protein of unknown function (DUF3501)